LKTKIRALTQQDIAAGLRIDLTRLGQIMHGWANYFKHAVAKWTFSNWTTSPGGDSSTCCGARHRWNWGQLRHHLTKGNGRWVIAADGSSTTASRSA